MEVLTLNRDNLQKKQKINLKKQRLIYKNHILKEYLNKGYNNE
jgi:hypothetical protein